MSPAHLRGTGGVRPSLLCLPPTPRFPPLGVLSGTEHLRGQGFPSPGRVPGQGSAPWRAVAKGWNTLGVPPGRGRQSKPGKLSRPHLGTLRERSRGPEGAQGMVTLGRHREGLSRRCVGCIRFCPEVAAAHQSRHFCRCPVRFQGVSNRCDTWFGCFCG